MDNFRAGIGHCGGLVTHSSIDRFGAIMNFTSAIKSGFFNFTNFRGTATRAEYWYWQLFTFLVGLPLLGLGLLVGSDLAGLAWSPILEIAGAAVLVRRLRDAGRSPWQALILAVPLAVQVVLKLVLTPMAGSPEFLMQPGSLQLITAVGVVSPLASFVTLVLLVYWTLQPTRFRG